jgi:hypothetical protein
MTNSEIVEYISRFFSLLSFWFLPVSLCISSISCSFFVRLCTRIVILVYAFPVMTIFIQPTNFGILALHKGISEVISPKVELRLAMPLLAVTENSTRSTKSPISRKA